MRTSRVISDETAAALKRGERYLKAHLPVAASLSLHEIKLLVEAGHIPEARRFPRYGSAENPKLAGTSTLWPEHRRKTR